MRRALSLAVLFSVTILVLGACVRRTVAPTYTLGPYPATPTMLWRATHRWLQAHGYHVDRADPAAGVIEVASPSTRARRVLPPLLIRFERPSWVVVSVSGAPFRPDDPDAQGAIGRTVQEHEELAVGLGEGLARALMGEGTAGGEATP